MGMIGKHNAIRICDIRGENFKKVHFQPLNEKVTARTY